jgi:hypothetical protein
MEHFAHFLISQFIWAMTFGFYHVFFSFIAMFLFFKYWERLSYLQSFIVSVVTHVVSVGLFNVIIKYAIIDLGKYHYDPINPVIPAFSPWNASLTLGITYAVLQTLFLMGMSIKYPWLHKARIVLIIIMSNLISSILVYKFLPASYLYN